MGPRKRGPRQRKPVEDLEGEKEEDNIEEKVDWKRRKYHGSKKYIGAHVGIQGSA